MKDFLSNSTIPYWIVFGLVTAAGIIALLNMRKKTISKESVRLVTLLALTGTALGLIIYSIMGGSSIWWCTSSDYSFFGKLVRVIPLIIFVGIQLAQVFVYKIFVGQYFQKELSIKGSFISLIIIVPATIFLYIILDLFGMGQGMKDTIFYIIICLSLIAGTGWAMTLNVQSIGEKIRNAIYCCHAYNDNRRANFFDASYNGIDNTYRTSTHDRYTRCRHILCTIQGNVSRHRYTVAY